LIFYYDISKKYKKDFNNYKKNVKYNQELIILLSIITKKFIINIKKKG